LLDYIGLTPLERLFQIYAASQDTMFFRIAGCYDAFLRQLNNKSTRDQLRNMEYADRYKSDEFAILKANSDALAAEIVRFLYARRGQWSDRFFEYVLI